MDKIKKAFENGANIGYIVAGYPSIEHTKNFLNSLDECALDIVEIGIPYSDPLADGPVVFNASFQAVQNGVKKLPWLIKRMFLRQVSFGVK